MNDSVRSTAGLTWGETKRLYWKNVLQDRIDSGLHSINKHLWTEFFWKKAKIYGEDYIEIFFDSYEGEESRWDNTSICSDDSHEGMWHNQSSTNFDNFALKQKKKFSDLQHQLDMLTCQINRIKGKIELAAKLWSLANQAQYQRQVSDRL